MSEDKPEIDSRVVIPSFVSIEEVGSVELETAEEEEVPPESTATVTTTAAATVRSTLSPPRRRVRLTSITEVIEEEDDFDSFASPCQSITLKCDIKIIVTSYDDDDDDNGDNRTFVTPDSPVPLVDQGRD